MIVSKLCDLSGNDSGFVNYANKCAELEILYNGTDNKDYVSGVHESSHGYDKWQLKSSGANMENIIGEKSISYQILMIIGSYSSRIIPSIAPGLIGDSEIRDYLYAKELGISNPERYLDKLREK
jgi:hypothetical protein